MSAAHRYAAAALGAVRQHPAQAEDFAASVSALAQGLAASGLGAILANPRLTLAQRSAIAATCAKATDAPPMLNNLLQVLARNGRLHLLPAVLKHIMAMQAVAGGILPVVVHSAVKLTDSQKVQLKVQLKQLTRARDVSLTEQLRPGLQGGFRAFWSGMVWDASVQGSLQRLKTRLNAAVSAQ